MLQDNARSTRATLSDVILALFATTLFPHELWIPSSCSKTYAAVDEVEY